MCIDDLFDARLVTGGFNEKGSGMETMIQIGTRDCTYRSRAKAVEEQNSVTDVRSYGKSSNTERAASPLSRNDRRGNLSVAWH